MSVNILDTIIAQSKLSKKETVKQQRIIEHAIALFAEKGYANTSTSEIAKASGVAEGTIFRHYGTKDNLLLSVIVPFLKEFNPMLTQEVIETIRAKQFASCADFLHALIHNRLHFLLENKEIFQIVVKELLYREELRNELIPHIRLQHVFAFLHEALDLFKARGELVDLPNELLLRMMFSCVIGYFATRFFLAPNRTDVSYDEEVDQLIRFMLEGVKRRD